MPSTILKRSEEERIETQSSTLADTLVHLWALGKLLGDVELQKTTMDELVKWYVEKCVPSFVSEQTIEFVDRITQVEPESPLRQFCVLWARCMSTIVGDLPQFGETAPEWLSEALLISESEYERREDAQDEELEQKARKREKRKRKRKAKDAKKMAKKEAKKAAASVGNDDNDRGPE